jgi:hypothetical protein
MNLNSPSGISSFPKLVHMIIMIICQCILCKYANATTLSFSSYFQTCVCIHNVDFKKIIETST